LNIPEKLVYDVDTLRSVNIGVKSHRPRPRKKVAKHFSFSDQSHEPNKGGTRRAFRNFLALEVAPSLP
jgi:hypothetical protein